MKRTNKRKGEMQIAKSIKKQNDSVMTTREKKWKIISNWHSDIFLDLIILTISLYLYSVTRI